MSSPKPALNCLKSVARYELDSYIAIDSICVIAEANAIELGARLLSRVPAGWWEDSEEDGRVRPLLKGALTALGGVTDTGVCRDRVGVWPVPGTACGHRVDAQDGCMCARGPGAGAGAALSTI